MPRTSGVREFQLHLLAGMRRNEPLVERALRRLGTDRAEMDRCRTAIGTRVFLPAGDFANVAEILGPPAFSEAAGPAMTRLGYTLPLWPDLAFCFVGVPGLPVSHDFGFRRSPGAPVVLRPWGCVLDDVTEAFGAPVEEGDVWPPYGQYVFRSGRRSLGAIFSWNLLQDLWWIERD